MNTLWKRTALLLSAALCLTLFSGGCSDSDDSQNPDLRQIKIGMTVYRQDDTFISTLSGYFLETAKARESRDKVKISVNVMDGKGNQGIQNDQVDKFLSQGYDVICVNEVDRTAASVIIDKAKSANIPIVFFNREPVEEDMQRWDRAYYVGAIASESGVLQGRIVSNLFNQNPELVDRNGDGKIQYVMLEGEPGHQDAAIRTEYSIKTVTGAGISVEKLANDTANWQRAQASAKMGQWLKDEEIGPRIEVVFSNNDDMALGAIDAYRAAGIEDLPVIVGHRRNAPRPRSDQGGDADRNRAQRRQGTGRGDLRARLRAFHRAGRQGGGPPAGGAVCLASPPHDHDRERHAGVRRLSAKKGLPFPGRCAIISLVSGA